MPENNEDPIIVLEAMPEPENVNELKQVIIREGIEDPITKHTYTFDTMKDLAESIKIRLKDHKDRKYGLVGIRLSIRIKRGDAVHRKIISRDDPKEPVHTLYADTTPIPAE